MNTKQKLLDSYIADDGTFVPARYRIENWDLLEYSPAHDAYLYAAPLSALAGKTVSQKIASYEDTSYNLEICSNEHNA